MGAKPTDDMIDWLKTQADESLKGGVEHLLHGKIDSSSNGRVAQRHGYHLCYYDKWYFMGANKIDFLKRCKALRQAIDKRHYETIKRGKRVK